jgi:Pvc16 N-terminal domain
MSSYLVISAVSEALRQLLWQEFEPDPLVQPIVGSEQAIVFSNPTETGTQPANRLSIWLYRVTENPYLKNQPATRANGADSARQPPLALDLHYLVTPFAPSGDLDHVLLGKTMQVLYDNAVTLLRIPANGIAEELRVILATLTLEELTRVWEALREPYRLSIGYLVRVTQVESLRTTDYRRVIDRIAGFGDRSLEEALDGTPG